MVFAISISEFVDAMIVAQLLGSTAMSIVNLATPIMMLTAAIGSLMGIGGSTIYTNLSGSHQPEKALLVYTVTIISLVAIVALFSALMLVFFAPLTGFLCDGNADIEGMASAYIKVLILSVPVIAFANGIIMFLPSAGNPNIGTALIILANLVNLSLDIVFIRFCGLGICGAALATVTGYAVSLLAFDELTHRNKISIHFCKVRLKDFSLLSRICAMGSSSALSQLSFAVKFAFCNAVALRLGGPQGLIAISVCFQMLSIASIFVGGIGSTLVRVIAFLKGQKDFREIGKITSYSYLLQFVSSALLVVGLILFRSSIASLYNVTDLETLKLTTHAICIFSFCILLRGLNVNFMFYVQSIGHSIYASAISLLDGFVIIIPITLILCPIIGLDGLWLAFPLYTALLLLIILIVNALILKSGKEHYAGITLVERDVEVLETSSISGKISAKSTNIADKIPDEEMRKVAQDYFAAITANKADAVLADLLVRCCHDRDIVEIRTEADKLYTFPVPEGGIRIKNDMGLGLNTLQISSERSLSGGVYLC